MTDVPAAPSTYPVAFDVERQLIDRNRVTTLFRLILAVPHILILGGGAFAFGRFGGTGGSVGGGGLYSAAVAMAIVAWFAIVFATLHPRGLWDFGTYYVRCRIPAGAYLALFRD